MGTHMKTTVDLPDVLVKEAKEEAARRGTTLRALIEAGLRMVLGERRKGKPFRMRDARVDGKGLVPDLRGASWDRIRDASYEGRGG